MPFGDLKLAVLAVHADTPREVLDHVDPGGACRASHTGSLFLLQMELVATGRTLALEVVLLSQLPLTLGRVHHRVDVRNAQLAKVEVFAGLNAPDHEETTIEGDGRAGIARVVDGRGREVQTYAYRLVFGVHDVEGVDDDATVDVEHLRLGRNGIAEELLQDAEEADEGLDAARVLDDVFGVGLEVVEPAAGTVGKLSDLNVAT
jgi:hypothetical protein